MKRVLLDTKTMLLVGVFGIISSGFSQVGINTASPQAILAIQASNTTSPSIEDGILIPSVDEFPSSNPGINQDGMLLFITGNGTAARGFYYWDFTQSLWVLLYTSDNNKDWFQTGTSNSPTAITDNIYTQGNVGINQISPSWPLDVISTSGGRGLSLAMIGTSTLSTFGAITEISTVGDATHAGFVSRVLDNGNGAHYGMQTLNSGTGSGNHYGVLNQLGSSGQGIQIGVGNTISNTGDNTHYGIRSDLSGSGNGVHYGSYQNLTGSGNGNKIGTRIYIDPASGGTHYGLFSEALGANAYAGYFLGTVSFGSATSNRYQFPSSDGAGGEALITDGSGNVQWQSVVTPSDKLALKAYPSSPFSLTNSVELELTFDQVAFNYGNGIYDTSLGEIRLIDSGVYMVSAQLTLDFNGSISNTSILVYRIYNNGVMVEEITDQAGAFLNPSFVASYQFNSLIEINPGDTIKLSITPVWGGGTPAPVLLSNSTSFSITRMY